MMPKSHLGGQSAPNATADFTLDGREIYFANALLTAIERAW